MFADINCASEKYHLRAESERVLHVHAHVLLELVGLEEALVAQRAGVWPLVLVAVRAHVALVGRLDGEVGAAVAAEGPLVRVRAHVAAQAVRVAEAAIADGAVVVLVTSVLLLVQLAAPDGAQHLAAVVARVLCNRNEVSFHRHSAPAVLEIHLIRDKRRPRDT